MPFWVLPLFFGASGAAFLRYGIYQRRKIGGHSFLFGVYGILLIWLAGAIAAIACG